MDTKFIKRLGLHVPSLGLGTWKMGGQGFGEHTDEESIKALRRGIELGAKLIDTAEMYANGSAEELVGRAIRGFSREELFIVTKVWPTHARHKDVIKSAQASSKRLGTYIDLYLLHWPAEDVPICETMGAMEELINSGIVKHIGLSNFDVEGIRRAESCLKRNEISAIQNRFSVLHKADLSTVVRYAEKEGMMYMAYTPIEKGALSRSEFLKRIGGKYGKTPIQVALNWLICIQPVVPIPKASKLEHVEENVGAMDWRLSSEDWETILKSL